ncbi:hypothetical protein P5673_031199 [Acropora cervicornis]|uniref:Uncharacterized protein n=1 Tax=Acropora cervicornis TaxID=6130 RepID=A0AAD9PTH5_ACRCE|nr:hypothetical protein P5673_031199 [Acropora cervicornis]
MGKKRYFCSHCNDYVSRGTRSNHLKELAEANGSFYDTDDSESFEAFPLENDDSNGSNNRRCSDGMNSRRVHDGIFTVFPSQRERQVSPSLHQVFQEESCVIVWSEAKELIMLTEVAAEGGFTHEQGLRVLVCLTDT